MGEDRIRRIRSHLCAMASLSCEFGHRHEMGFKSRQLGRQPGGLLGPTTAATGLAPHARVCDVKVSLVPVIPVWEIGVTAG